MCMLVLQILKVLLWRSTQTIHQHCTGTRKAPLPPAYQQPTFSNSKHFINGTTATIAGPCILQEQPMSWQMIVAGYGTSQMNNCEHISICIMHRVYYGNSASCSQRWILHLSPPCKGSNNLQICSCYSYKDRSIVAHLAGKMYRVRNHSHQRFQYNPPPATW